MPDEKDPSNAELPAIKILQQIKEGIIDKDKLPKEMRQECVEYLLSKFQSISEIALILGKTEKTIRRDKEEIDAQRAIKPSVDYSGKLIAELMRKASATQEQLMHLARSPGKVQETSQAAYYLWKAIQEQMKLLQSLGLLPEQPMKFEASITQEDERDVTKLKEELLEAERMAREAGRSNDPVIVELVKSIKQQIALAEAGNKIDELKNILNKKDGGASNEQSSQ
jgi:IS30 family transposase